MFTAYCLQWQLHPRIGHLLRVQKVLQKARLFRVHDAGSKVTELRKKCLPFEGTLDFWVLLFITAINLVAVVVGVFSLEDKGAIFTFGGCNSQNIQMIALVFAFIEATPGLLFIMCAARCLLLSLLMPVVVFGMQ